MVCSLIIPIIPLNIQKEGGHMAIYLNTNAAYKDFQMLSREKYFVDKSAMEKHLY